MRWVGVGLLAAVGILGVLLSGFFPGSAYSFHGSAMNPPFTAPNFTLIDTQGKTFDLSNQHGSAILLYFGYTHCPDECPLAMSTYSQVMQGLGKQAGSVRFVFITVDPARDTPQTIAAFLSHFNSGIIGLTGTTEQLQSAWQGYGVYQQGSSNGQKIDHSDQIFLIDPQGKVRVIYPNNISPSQLLPDVRAVFKGG